MVGQLHLSMNESTEVIEKMLERAKARVEKFKEQHPNWDEHSSSRGSSKQVHFSMSGQPRSRATMS